MAPIASCGLCEGAWMVDGGAPWATRDVGDGLACEGVVRGYEGR